MSEEMAHRRLWPSDAAPDYMDARRELLAAEKELLDHAERVAAARRALPPGPVLPQYEFTEGPRDLEADGPVVTSRLGALFGGHDTLVMYHLMYPPDAEEACPMCSMWVDGLHGVSHHITRHAGLVVAAKASLPELRAWARRRGWTGLRLVSAHGSGFNAHLGVEADDGSQHPGISVFTRKDGQIRHRYTMQATVSAEFRERGIDLLSPVWQLLDLLPGGRGDWYARNDYASAARG